MSDTVISGEAGTTGREVFEHSTATGPGPGYGLDHGESATTGFEGADGLGAGGATHHHHDAGGPPPATTGSAGHDLVGGTAGAGKRNVEGADPHANTGAHIPGTTGTGGGVAPPAPGQGQYVGEEHRGGHPHHHHQHHQKAEGEVLQSGGGVDSGDIGGSDRSQIAGEYGADRHAEGGHVDRVGPLNQGGAMYERTTDQGPVTTGAAGTDRFDTDKPSRSGILGNDSGVREPQTDIQETTSRAEGKSSGGLMGILTTSDKDFTGRDRLGTGAYADTDGRFSSNTTGPGGHTALTGREGNIENNPVAQAKGISANDSGVGGRAGQGQGTRGDDTSVDEGGAAKKKGFMDKIKGALS